MLFLIHWILLCRQLSSVWRRAREKEKKGEVLECFHVRYALDEMGGLNGGGSGGSRDQIPFLCLASSCVIDVAVSGISPRIEIPTIKEIVSLPFLFEIVHCSEVSGVGLVGFDFREF